MSGKVIQVFAPGVGIVAVGIHVPDVGQVLLFEVVMDALGDADQTVHVATTEVQQLQM